MRIDGLIFVVLRQFGNVKIFGINAQVLTYREQCVLYWGTVEECGRGRKELERYVRGRVYRPG